MRLLTSPNYISQKHSFFKRKFVSFQNYFIHYKSIINCNLYILTNKNKIKIDHNRICKNSIPVIINNFNRLTSLEKIIKWLNSLDGNLSLIIIDNKSTYQPLLNYYKKLNNPSIQLIRMNFNSGIFSIKYFAKQLKRYDKYIVTDSDFEPYYFTPKDTIVHISKLLDKYPQINHIGTALRIDDIPDHYPLKKYVQNWESKFWPPKTCLINNEVYKAGIDTSFAMYRNTSDVLELKNAYRTAFPYLLKHSDWYIDINNIDDEQKFYLNSCNHAATWSNNLKKTIEII